MSDIPLSHYPMLICKITQVVIVKLVSVGRGINCELRMYHLTPSRIPTDFTRILEVRQQADNSQLTLFRSAFH